MSDHISSDAPPRALVRIPEGLDATDPERKVASPYDPPNSRLGLRGLFDRAVDFFVNVPNLFTQLKLSWTGDLVGYGSRFALRAIGYGNYGGLLLGQCLSDEMVSSVLTAAYREADGGRNWKSYSYELVEGIMVRGMMVSVLEFLRLRRGATLRGPLGFLFQGFLLAIGGVVAEQVTRSIGSKVSAVQPTSFGLRLFDSCLLMTRGRMIQRVQGRFGSDQILGGLEARASQVLPPLMERLRRGILTFLPDGGELPPSGEGPRKGHGFTLQGLTPDDLKRIHCTGLDLSPEVLLEFKAVRDLEKADQGLLESLWKEHNEQVVPLQSQWESFEEYLDPSRPLAMGEEIGEEAWMSVQRTQGQLEPDRKRRILELHFLLRASLYRERVWKTDEIRDRRWPAAGIRYLPLFDERLPIRTGTMPVRLRPIDEAIALYEQVVHPLDSEERGQIRAALIKLEVARGYQLSHGWTGPLIGRHLRTRLFPGIPPSRLILLNSLLAYHSGQKGGNDLLRTLPERIDFEDFVGAIAKVLAVSPGVLARELKLRRGRRSPWFSISPVLQGLNLIRADKPEEFLYRLYREELDWAFHVQRRENGCLVFEMGDLHDLSQLLEGGLARLLTEARLQRGWSLKDLADQSSQSLGRAVSPKFDIGRFADGNRAPSFPFLRALVTALNEHREAPPIDPAKALLACRPDFIFLLTLAVEGQTILMPVRGLYRPVVAPPPRPTQVHIPRRKGMSHLAPKGLPYLLREARVGKGWSCQRAARRLGLAYCHYRVQEREPADAPAAYRKGKWKPGRVFLRVLTLKKGGYGLDPEKILEAYGYTHWRDDPVVQRLRERTFQQPVYIDREAVGFLNGYCTFPFQTPAELLYLWRNSLCRPVREGRLEFLPDRQRMARFLGVPSMTYRAWEGSLAVPGAGQVDSISDRLSLSAHEKTVFQGACDRMREELLKQVALPPGFGWIQEYPSIARLVSLAQLRFRASNAQDPKFFEKMKYLHEHDPDSLKFIDLQARHLAEDPMTEEVRRLIYVTHKTEEALRRWPSKIGRSGPLAAVYFYGLARHALFGRLKYLLHRRRPPLIIIDGTTGNIEPTTRT